MVPVLEIVPKSVLVSQIDPHATPREDGLVQLAWFGDFA